MTRLNCKWEKLSSYLKLRLRGLGSGDNMVASSSIAGLLSLLLYLSVPSSCSSCAAGKNKLTFSADEVSDCKTKDVNIGLSMRTDRMKGSVIKQNIQVKVSSNKCMYWYM